MTGAQARPVAAAPHPLRRLFGEARGVTWTAGFVIFLVTMMLIRPMAMSLLSWQRTAGMLSERRAEVARLEHRHDVLVRQVDHYTTPAYVIEQARAYGLVLPGERGFVIRELAHPRSAGAYAAARLRNATADRPPVRARRARTARSVTGGTPRP